MKKNQSILLFLIMSNLTFGQINGKIWKIESQSMVINNDTITFFHKDSLNTKWTDLYSFEVEYFENHTYKALNILRNPDFGTWNFINSSKIKIDKDTLDFIQISGSKISYIGVVKALGVNNEIITGNTITKLYSDNTCKNNLSLKSGKWNDNSLWYCGHLPTITENVIINPFHKVILDGSIRGNCKTILLRNGAFLDDQKGLFIATPH